MAYIVIYYSIMECSFLELRCKEVINVVDGRRLGHIIDIVFNLASGNIEGLIVPGEKGFWNIFKKNSELFIPYHQICKIGEDTILVELYAGPGGRSIAYTAGENKKREAK